MKDTSFTDMRMEKSSCAVLLRHLLTSLNHIWINPRHSQTTSTQYTIQLVSNKTNLSQSPPHPPSTTVKMKRNDVIAIIIIILFIILAGVSFGIWKLVNMAKNHMSAAGSGTSSSHTSDDIAD
ncbi:hypothetical protein NCS52_00350600 [Fusarium sp. LHS14.1]|nr:hypothetical protein NCS52_00350600 [Fusarium sp. LHS14.1]